jgi:hypothetical protein
LRNKGLVLFFVLMAACTLSLRAGSVFINGEVPAGTMTPFYDTNNGLTALFASNVDPGFIVESGSYSFGPEILAQMAGAPNTFLGIGFSAPVSSISMYFLTNGPGPFDLSAYLGGVVLGTLVGTATATGSGGDGSFEAFISFSGQTFDGVVLTSPETSYFAVGDIDVTAVPEPSAWIPLTAGLAGMLAILRRRVAQGEL